MSGVPANHEFSDSENQVIASLSTSLSRLAAPLLAFAVVQGVSALWIYRTSDPAWGEGFYPFAGLVAVVSFAFWGVCCSASKQLELIVDTEGSDIDHLMTAIENLKKAVMLLIPVAIPVVAGLFILLVQAYLTLSQAG